MILTLQEIRKTLKKPIQKGTSMDYIKSLSNGDYGSIIDYDVFLPSIGKNLQRPFCWTLEQKQELIISLLKGIKLPSIAVVIHKDGNGVFGEQTIQVIDGKQRLSTIISYFRGEFPIIWEGFEYKISDLDGWGYREIAHYNFISDRMYSYDDDPVTDEDKINWFKMINWAGTPQDKEHMNSLINDK